MRRKKLNKKAQIQQIAFIMVLIFSFIIAAIVGKKVLNDVDTALTDSGLHTNYSDLSINRFKAAWPTFDYMIIFVVVGLTLGLVITSFLIPSHPIFIVSNIVGLFVLVFIAAAMSNMYYEMTVSDGENPVFNEVVNDGNNDFVRMTFVMKRLPYICIAIVFLSTIAMYSKGKREGGY